MPKSPDAFRTISEVADWLGIQAHVLRFWESKFTQVKPIKRAGGRRYYRPTDMLLLGGIRQLLHEDGLTIKGVQKILREEGVAHVASMSQPLDELTQSQLDSDDQSADTPIDVVAVQPESAVVLSFDDAQSTEMEISPDLTPEPVYNAPEVAEEAPAPAPDVEVSEPRVEPAAPEMPEPAENLFATEPAAEPEVVQASDGGTSPELEDTEVSVEPESIDPEAEVASEPRAAEEAPVALPAFLRRPLADPEEAAEPEAPQAPKPRVIDMPTLTPLQDIAAAPSLLTTAFRTRSLSTDQAREVGPLLDRLTLHRDQMAASLHSGSDA